MKRTKLSEKPWYNGAVIACIAVAFYVLLTNLGTVLSSVRFFLSNFNSIVLGAIFAYLMNPLAKLYQRSVFKKIRSESPKWTLSIVLSVITVILFLILIMSILIPQLFESIVNFISNIDS